MSDATRERGSAERASGGDMSGARRDTTAAGALAVTLMKQALMDAEAEQELVDLRKALADGMDVETERQSKLISLDADLRRRFDSVPCIHTGDMLLVPRASEIARTLQHELSELTLAGEFFAPDWSGEAVTEPGDADSWRRLNGTGEQPYSSTRGDDPTPSAPYSVVRYHSISMMGEYEEYSPEELRMRDYELYGRGHPDAATRAVRVRERLGCCTAHIVQLEHNRMQRQLDMDELWSSALAEGTDESEDVQRALLRGVTNIDCVNLKLFAAVCKAGHNARALNLARQLNLPKSLTAAMKLANHYKLPSLAERISMMMSAEQRAELGVAVEAVPVSEAPEAVSNVCCICCEEMTSPAKVDCPAEHEFCVGCIVPWLGERDSGGRRRDTCPLCRSQVTEVRVGDEVWGSGVAERAAGPSTESTSRHQSRVPSRRFVPPTSRSGLPRWLLRPGMTFGRCWEYGCGRGEVFGVCEDRGFCDLHCFGCDCHDRMCTQCISSRQYHEGSRRTCYRGFCAHCCFGGCDEHENRW